MKFVFNIDYRDFNAIIIKNRYFLFLISETLNRLNRAQIFIKFNIIAVFNRLRIRENDEKLTAFRIRFDFFEYLIMPFGLCNSPVSFQHYINDNLQEYLDDFCIAYLDNILIYLDNKLEHKHYMKKVLERLYNTSLQIDLKKCKFYVT